jgi:hypothetical protein
VKTQFHRFRQTIFIFAEQFIHMIPLCAVKLELSILGAA